MEGLGGEAVQGYSGRRRRSLITMVGRRAFRNLNGTANVVLVKPLVVMAARILGPGATRLRLVKLAHQLEPRGLVVAEPEGGFIDRPKPAAAAKRAA